MNILKDKPYILFWISIPALIIIGNLDVGDSALDINVHDTYLVIANEHLAILISLYFGLVGIIYWIYKKLNRRLNRTLNSIHTEITVGGTFLMVFATYLFLDSVLSSYVHDLEKYEYLNITITIISMLVVVVQTLFLFNMIIGLFHKK